MYAALAYHESLPEGRLAGELMPSRDGLSFHAPSLMKSLPLKGLVIKHGGTAGRLIWFTHPDLPGWSFSTGAAAILQDPVLDHQSQVASQASQVRGKRRIALGIMMTLLLLIAAVPLTLWLAREPLVAVAVDRVPLSLDLKIGEMMEEGLVQGAEGRRLIKDPQLLAELETILAPLRPALRQEFAWRVHIIEDETQNAFAAPGGLMVIHSGLLQMAGSADEVLGVMAHEISHCNERHSVHALVRQTGSMVLLGLLFGDVSSGTALLLEGSRRLWMLDNSRSMEYEADDKGWDIMVQQGLDPRGMTEIFRKLQAYGDAHSHGLAIPEMLSTHPETGERVKALDLRWARHPSAQLKKSGVDYSAFKKRLQEVLNAAEAKPDAQP